MIIYVVKWSGRNVFLGYRCRSHFVPIFIWMRKYWTRIIIIMIVVWATWAPLSMNCIHTDKQYNCREMDRSHTSNNGFYVMMRPPWWCHIYQLFCFKQLTELVGHVDCHKALKLFHTHTPINIPHNAQISRCLMGNQMSTWLFQMACTTQDWLHEHFVVGKSCDYVTRIIIKTHPNQPTKC